MERNSPHLLPENPVGEPKVEFLQNPALEHVPVLDGIRGLAVGLVLIVHGYNRGPDLNFPDSAQGHFLDQLLRFGWTGVELFFVLSGFLVTSILIENKRAGKPLRIFYARRVARIMPAYFAAFSGVAALSFVSIGPLVDPVTADARENWVFYALALNNYFGWLGIDASQASKALGPLWSVASEEQYYLLWPVLIHALSMDRLKYALPALLAVNIAARVCALEAGVSPNDVYVASITHLDGIIIGSMMAIHREAAVSLLRHHAAWLLLAVGGVLAVFLFFAGDIDAGHRPIQIYGYPLIAVFYSLLIVHAMNGGIATRWLSSTPLRTLGKYSYFIYLSHWPAMLVLDHVVPGEGALVWLLYLGCLTAGLVFLASISWKFFEYPIIRMVRKRESRLMPVAARAER